MFFRREKQHTGPIEVVLYTRSACCLCDVAKEAIAKVAASAGVEIALREVDVDADPADAAKFGSEVPVVFVEGRKAFKYRVDEKKLAARFARLRS
jgi:glutaredoxin